MYKLVKRKFKAPNGARRSFWYREDTNDYNTIVGAFCEDEYKVLEQKFRKDDIVLDLGAHIGAVTLLYTTMLPDLKIYAFEAVRENFELLKKNIREFSYGGEINIFNQAVWFYDDDDAKLYYGDNSETGKIHKFIGSLFTVRDFYDKRVFKKVNTISLSKIFEEYHIFSCRFVKMDIEGSEYGVLKGTPKEVLEMIDRIHGEYHWVGAHPLKNPRSTLLLLAKEVYKDITPGGEGKPVGPFFFVKK